MERKDIIKKLRVIIDEFDELLINNYQLELEEFKKYLAINKKIWDLLMDLINEEYNLN